MASRLRRLDASCAGGGLPQPRRLPWRSGEAYVAFLCVRALENVYEKGLANVPSRAGANRTEARGLLADGLPDFSPCTISPNRQRRLLVLQRTNRAFYRWTWEERPKTSRRGAQARKWHIDHEYQIQDLLWRLRAPLFGNLKEEEV